MVFIIVKRVKMATPASATQTGFGPGASVRADRMIPVFDEKREFFQIFELCLKTASMSLGLDALLLRPDEFEEQISQARVRTRSRTVRKPFPVSPLNLV